MQSVYTRTINRYCKQNYNIDYIDYIDSYVVDTPDVYLLRK